jgi:hypothetical protein
VSIKISYELFEHVANILLGDSRRLVHSTAPLLRLMVSASPTLLRLRLLEPAFRRIFSRHHRFVNDFPYGFSIRCANLLQQSYVSIALSITSISMLSRFFCLTQKVASVSLFFSFSRCICNMAIGILIHSTMALFRRNRAFGHVGMDHDAYDSTFPS